MLSDWIELIMLSDRIGLIMPSDWIGLIMLSDWTRLIMLSDWIGLIMLIGLFSVHLLLTFRFDVMQQTKLAARQFLAVHKIILLYHIVSIEHCNIITNI